MGNLKQTKSKQELKQSVRYVAMTVLTEVIQKQAYANHALQRALQKHAYADADRRLLTELVYGVLQRLITLDAVLAPSIQLTANPVWLQMLLRLSVFQLLFLDRVPAHAVLYEAVAIAKIKGHLGLGKLVNGVLRNVQREGAQRLTHLSEGPVTEAQIAVRYSMPQWLVAYFAERLGLERTEQLAASVIKPATLSVRVQGTWDRPLGDRQRMMEQLAQEGVVCEPSVVSPQGLRVMSGRLLHTQAFRNGAVTIQDESSMLVAACGSIQPHMHILDACAAPGGKATHIASFLDAAQGGRLHALDLYAHKCALIQEQAQRLGVSDCLTISQADATQADRLFQHQYFDVAFVDAPCSGIGLMRRKPELKYTKKYEDSRVLHDIQQKILAAVAPTVKKGGKIIYSTCTLLAEENEHSVARFLEVHPDFECHSLQQQLALPQSCFTKEGAVLLYPDQFETDGFFICCLVKKA